MHANLARLQAGKTAKPANQATGTEVASASAFYTEGFRSNTGGGGNTTIINNNNNSQGGTPTGNTASAGTSARLQGLEYIALARR
jgi:hypothetical protein